MERKILGLTLRNRTPNAELRGLSNMDYVTQYSKRLERKWRGSLEEIPDYLVGTDTYHVGSINRKVKPKQT